MATLDKATVDTLAEHLENAELEARDVVKITDDYPAMDYEDAYNIQWEIRRRKESRGHRIVGTMSRTLSPPSPAPSPAIDTRSLDSNETRATASSYTPSSDARSLPG